MPAILADHEAFCEWICTGTGLVVRPSDRLQDVCDPLARWCIIAALETHLLDDALPTDLLDACDTVEDLFEWFRNRSGRGIEGV